MSDQNTNSYKATFFVVPSRILDLPGITLAFLKFYETIFQFWNHGKFCYLSNDMLKERSGISSSATIQEAFVFFETLGEMKRKTKGKLRYIVQPEKEIEFESVDNSKKDRSKSGHALGTARANSRQSETLPLGTARHNNKKYNNKNINKRDCATGVARSPSFDTFWNLYPVKKNRLRAKQIWDEKGCEAKSGLICEDVSKRKRFDSQWQDKKYIPHPYNYLADQLWEDEMIVESPSKKIEYTQKPAISSYGSMRDFTQERLDRERNLRKTT